MKKTNLFRSLLVLMLTLSMFVGTCATSFAGYILTDDEVAYVENLVDETKDEIQRIIDVAKEGTDEDKLAKIDEYINNITDALVFVGYDNADEVAATIRGEVLDIAALAEAGDMDAVNTKVEAYINFIKTLDDVDAEKVDEIAGIVQNEVVDFIEIVENQDDEAAKDKIDAYVAFIKEALEIDEADEAKLAEVIAEITAFVEEIKNIPAEDVEAAVDAFVAEIKAKLQLEAAKLGHQHYVKDDNSYYVAIGGDTVKGTAIDTDEDEVRYFDLIAENYGANKKIVAVEKLLPSAVVELIAANEAEIAKADLITYQMDASSIIYAILRDTPDWNKYPQEKALIDEVLSQIEAVLTTNWSEYADAKIEEILPEIKDKVLSNLPQNIPFTDTIFDIIADVTLPYIKEAIECADNKKDGVASKVEAVMSNPMVMEYAEKIAYAVVAYAVDTKNAIEAIQEINPEAALVVVGMYNPANGLVIETEDAAIDAGEYVEYAIDATNVYYTALAAANGNFAFVDVSDAETDGFAAPINVAALEVDQIIAMLLDAEESMHANAAGHAYIKDQIMKAFVCDYSVYEQLDANNHTVKCAMCEDSYTEAHTFVGNTCEKCGYEKVYTPVYGSVGGGGAASQFIVKFDTNGGSKIANVTVKKGETLTKPADPTKEGFDFGGWYTDKALTKAYDFATPVTKSFTLYAKWTEADTDVLAKFTDVSKDAWYYEYIKEIAAKGLMNGVSEAEFAPEATLTRGMFVTILHRVEGEAAVENAASFTDVADTEYYAAAVKWANANGIVNGVTETEFAPNAEVTREQMAAMLARFVEYKKIEVAAEGDVTYTDSDAISEYAQDAVKTANKLGILIGNADGSFAPKSNATRAEAAALFVRLLGVIEK